MLTKIGISVLLIEMTVMLFITWRRPENKAPVDPFEKGLQVQVSQQQVAAVPEQRCTNKDLRSMFDKYNAAYFKDQLPSSTFVHFEHSESWEGAYAGIVDIIMINPEPFSEQGLNNSCEEIYGFTMVHEMAHEWVAHNVNSTEKHGPNWKSEMRHLASIGALDERLWTDYDKP